MITSLQGAIKKLMIVKATARPGSGKADEMESIIQDVILGEQMLSGRIEQAEKLVERGVEIMTTEQVSQWAGVRNWQESS